MGAIKAGNKRIAHVLLDNGAYVKYPKVRSDYSLVAAAVQAKLECLVVRLVEKLGADIDAPEKKYSRSLYRAISWGNERLAQFLIDNGAYINAPGLKHEGNSLWKAISDGNKSMVRLLVKDKANVSVQKGKYIVTNPLQVAAIRGNESLVRFLIQNGADTDGKGDGEYGNALQSAVGHTAIAVVETG
jgi:ankyrin repeat protein